MLFISVLVKKCLEMDRLVAGQFMHRITVLTTHTSSCLQISQASTYEFENLNHTKDRGACRFGVDNWPCLVCTAVGRYPAVAALCPRF